MFISRRPRGSGLAVLLAATAMLSIASATAAVTTYYVDGVNGNDNWDGRSPEWDGGTGGPKKTIQAGINITVNGDEVIVADAVYTGAGNLDLHINGRAILLRSANGPDNCIIDGQYTSNPAFILVSEGPDTVIDGFMVSKFASC